MPALNHVHSYTRYKRHYYRCIDPHCSHYIDKAFLRGKANKCPGCGAEFILTPADLQRATPKCLECSNTRKARTFRAAKSAISNLLDSLEPPPPANAREAIERAKKEKEEME